METVSEAVIDTLSAGAAIAATMTTTSEPGVSIQTINLAPANIASIVEMVAAAMEPNLATIVASSVHKAMAALQADVTKLKKRQSGANTEECISDCQGHQLRASS